MIDIENFIQDLPDPDAARRFFGQLEEKHPSQAVKLRKDAGLCSDVLTIVSFSPLLATTVLQHPEYLWWLSRKRRESGVRSKDEMLESLAQFTSTNTQSEHHDLFARFRRRELLRIFLKDIRRLATIAEITEEISNLADAILEAGIKLARSEMDRRFGSPQETDEKARLRQARFCVVALGKLGSRELNYSSDIDLLFLYSADGETTGGGSRGKVTNKEYFIKLAEFASRLVSDRAGEGGAYRVDLRLRPHGTLGALATSSEELVRYYTNEARPWERQALIRSRGCAGDIELFREFFIQVENIVFSTSESIDSALRNVRLSKEKIDLGNLNKRGFDVKLGSGGIREIEFLAQALQLAFGGSDSWLRSPHTLISLSRLTDRGRITESELTDLSTAYEFLRRTEHVLQMENGLQTHAIPDDKVRRALIGRRVTFAGGGDFEVLLEQTTKNVARIFTRVFGDQAADESDVIDVSSHSLGQRRSREYVMASVSRSDVSYEPAKSSDAVLGKLTALSPHFTAMLAANPHLIANLPDPAARPPDRDYRAAMKEAVSNSSDLGVRLAEMRRTWARLLIEIVVLDAFEIITIREAKQMQTALAEASLEAAIHVVRDELSSRYKQPCEHLDLAILALGKLGGRGLDYDSDLDLVLVYDDKASVPAGVTHAEYFGRAAELLVNVVSSMTRDGSLYRIDLRLRPYGSKGMSAISSDPFAEYFRETAAVWEMLAFVKLRAVGGDLELGLKVESLTRLTIHQRAAALPVAELKEETLKIRNALEKQRARTQGRSGVDIKYGAGGMLDVYFATRYLQLRDNIPDDSENRSTGAMLSKLASHGSLSAHVYDDLSAGYEFLSAVDHNLRLTIGRTTRVPMGNRSALESVSSRSGLSSPSDLIEQLTLHRIAIRSAFEAILK